MRQFFLLFFLCVPAVLLGAGDPLERVARDLAKDVRRLNGNTIAVLDFPHHDGRQSEGPRVVSERLTQHLAKEARLAVVERGHLTQVLKELHLSETGVINPDKAKSLGRFLGADILVTGTLIDLDGGLTELNARAILSESGRIAAASRTLLDRTWECRPRLGTHWRRR